MASEPEVIHFKTSVLLKEDTERYRLLIVERRGFDVYCFIPKLGMHYSFHKSGKIHFQREEKVPTPEEQPPVVVISSTGTPIYTDSQEGSPIGFQCNSIRGLGVSEAIFTAIFSIESPSQDYQKFNRDTKECFTIDKDLLPPNTHMIQIGVWAVPTRNPCSFQHDHPSIPAHLLYKVEYCEPQIWIYAES